MKLTRISFLFLILFLFVPSSSYAQSAAEKSWQPFWTQFSAAVKNKSRPALKKLMSSESDFQAGGGGQTRDEWLKFMQEENLWGAFQKSIASGVKKGYQCSRPCRVTKGKVYSLMFDYIDGQWRWTGILGD